MGAVTNSTVFLVSGGARGITAQCVIEMAQQFHCRFILLGRTPLKDEPAWALNVSAEGDLKKQAIADAQARGEKPTPALISKAVSSVQAQREIRATLDAVRQAGGDAVYLSADITDPAALQAALATVKQLGAIMGILHGAGNLADKLIENKSEADFENVYSAKVQGLQNLLAVTDADALEFLVLFSSVAGFYGNIGQADYAIANEILNKTAHQFKQAQPNCHVVSVNWGPWDGGMVTAQLRAYFDSLGIAVIPVEVGTQMLVEELRAGSAASPVQIVIGSAILPQRTAAEGGELQTFQLRRSLRLEDSPFLADHVVNGQAVLPMVAAMSWMGSACEQLHRGYRFFSFTNYRVLKGIVFDDALADEFTLELKEVSKSGEEIVLDAQIRSKSAEGKPRFHYSARLILLAEIPAAPAHEGSFESEPAEEISGAQLYSDGTLFHGFSFQGIDRVLRLSDDGLMMRCVLPQIDAEYQGHFPVQAFNYFMADIGLQSLGIWARRTYDAGSLPLRAGEGIFYRNVAFGQPFYVTMTVRTHTDAHVSARVVLHDEQNQVYMIINDIEVTLSKRLNELFLKNRLPAAHAPTTVQ